MKRRSKKQEAIKWMMEVVNSRNFYESIKTKNTNPMIDIGYSQIVKRNENQQAMQQIASKHINLLRQPIESKTLLYLNEIC